MQNLPPKGRNDGHIFDHSKITDNIYIGSDLCKGGVCLIHGEEFRKLGVSVEINLSKENNELPPKELESYTWLPVADGYAPSAHQLDVGSSIINDAMSAGKAVYIHCKNGHGRSPTLVAAYLIRYLGKTPKEAEVLIEERRDEVHIEDNQMEALRKFEEKYRK